jgi:hypothetical protein
MAFSYELTDWMDRKDLNTLLTVDREYPGWAHEVVLISNVLMELAPNPENSVVITCGPTLMQRYLIMIFQLAAENLCTPLQQPTQYAPDTGKCCGMIKIEGMHRNPQYRRVCPQACLDGATQH